MQVAVEKTVPLQCPDKVRDTFTHCSRLQGEQESTAMLPSQTKPQLCQHMWDSKY